MRRSTPAVAAGTAADADRASAGDVPERRGPHHDLTEWWYYTGHLEADDGRRWGFEQVTFQILRAPLQPVYISHFAITDQQRSQFRYGVRGQRRAPRPQPSQGFAFDVDGWTDGRPERRDTLDGRP